MDNKYTICSSGPPPKKELASNPTRRTTTYHPSVWGYHFLKYTSLSTTCDDTEEKQEAEALREHVRKMIVNSSDEADKQLKLIDEIQRLGVSYHFETEIDDVLNEEFLKFSASSSDNTDNDLYMTSLRFRLLRQHGYHVSSDVFKKFKSNEGTFKDSFKNDTSGLLSLYEAAHMRLREEDILDEALEFTTNHLEHSMSKLFQEEVVHALNNPIRKSLNRILARSYIPIYEHQSSHIEILHRFAKLDFNILQRIHQRELAHITMWWKDINVAEKLPFARDRIVELYFWMTGVYFEPQYAFAREVLTKLIALLSIVDDTYDNYGTIEELSLFTNIIQRWDVNLTNQLPDYMKLIFLKIIDLVGVMETELFKQGRSQHIQYVKLAIKKIVRAYFDEANWYAKSYTPTFEEYMEVALVTTAHEVLAITSFVFGMPEIVNETVLDWIFSSDPLLLRASSFMCRLTDDIVGHEFEQERGHIASSIEIYMKQYGVTKEDAYLELNERVINSWKDMNQGSLQHEVPMTLVERIFNLSRVINLLYKDYDGYTHSKTKSKDLITLTLVQSVPL